MPTMPRPPGKGAKIAFKIIGVPQNYKPESKRKKRINKAINRDLTSRSRTT